MDVINRSPVLAINNLLDVNNDSKPLRIPASQNKSIKTRSISNNVIGIIIKFWGSLE
jgi:hypothetical protein